ncbi:two-component system, OmpR family, sensor kinase [Blastococcus aggregatus]|uniref:histidine kinase n=1 Tax=Blastococcus aggregatus TaxID=38502 RepID=A0A285V5D0_9ACTN|nr:HAMP domain-containing sensor histidine kinase [Blastococcus aggregatus]SOC49280.1 two-component system, OmpR family, sensor kinase [Blastococcus aggregatus]
MTAPVSTPVRSGPRVPLRITLVALLLLLVTIALAATGTAATSLLRDYLQDQQDDALRVNAESVAGSSRSWASEFCEGGRRFPSTDFVGCLVPSINRVFVFASPLDDQERLPDFDRVAERVEDLMGGDQGPDRVEPFDIRAQDGSTSWRMMAVALPDGNAALFASDLAGDEKVISRLVRIEIVVGLIVLTLLGVAGYALVRNSLRPLAEVERTAQAIAAGDLSQRVPEGNQRTEVGRLSTALNGMLTRIESAFRAQQASEAEARGSEEKMRRFVADASHELRTPLTSIRGFAELYRQGAVSSEEDLQRLMGRIESEGARMGGLVEDLLTLARLDQRRPLVLTPVDLAAIAGDAVHDARAVQPDRPIALHLDESLTDVPVVLGDEGRLRQVVGNLVTNALTHTPPGTRVTVSVGQDGDDALLLRVADEGPGMAAADAARAFERFYRADTSRTRNGDDGEAGGSGLGLAIAASLVQAHGGTIALDTAPGRGAVFTVRLHRTGPPAPPPPPPPPAAPDGAADQPA